MPTIKQRLDALDKNIVNFRAELYNGRRIIVPKDASLPYLIDHMYDDEGTDLRVFDTTTWAGIQEAVRAGAGARCLPVGTMIARGNLPWTVVHHSIAKNASGDTVPAMYIQCFKSMPRMAAGSGDWSASNHRAWLNSTFFNYFTGDLEGLLGIIQPIVIQTYNRAGVLEDTVDRFFLPTVTNVNGHVTATWRNFRTEGEIWDYWKTNNTDYYRYASCAYTLDNVSVAPSYSASNKARFRSILNTTSTECIVCWNVSSLAASFSSSGSTCAKTNEGVYSIGISACIC